ncbi:Na+/H+ antiporter NhaA [Streptomyces sp. NPDC093984]|uniref:DsbA family protein n=1 Tax=Streptomyces sp. NPDC093984 TaxID=3366052 RepID=UPI0037F8DBC0
MKQAGAAALVAALLAPLIWSNAFPGAYEAAREARLSLGLGSDRLGLDLRTWIDSGLMTFFFLLVGLEARNRLEMSDLLGYAAELGLDVRAFREDLRCRVHAGRVERDIASADTSGVSGTPTFFFNGQRHHGAHTLGALTQALEAAREGAEHARSGPVPREQLCVLRRAARRYRTRVPRELTGPGRSGRRTAARAGTRPVPEHLGPVGHESPQSRADAPLLQREPDRRASAA